MHSNREHREHRAAESGGVMLNQYLGPLRPFLDDDAINEICVNRPGEVWTAGRRGWERHDVADLSFATCERLVTLIAGFNGKALKERPLLSASLPSGERVQAIIPPGCETGTVSITVRKPSKVTFTLDELTARGLFAEVVRRDEGVQGFESELLAVLKKAQDSGDQALFMRFLNEAVRLHRNIVIAGPTNSGKTTLTNALITSIEPAERIITLEDVRELQLPHHPNRVHLLYSREASETNKMLLPKDALASCLRMTPDRILLAELRGDESWEYVKAVNTGHPGSITSMHANGALEAFEQLTAFIKDSPTGAHLPADYIMRRLFATIDIVVFMSLRKVREIYYNPQRKDEASR